jgi:phytoene desaturase
MDNARTALVIGSGFGGLAAAIRLGAKGYQVTVLEKLDQAGGRAIVHRQDGFVFDAGPTIITAPFLLEELWSLCDKRMSDDIDLRSLNPFYTIRFDDGAMFNYSGDTASMHREIARFDSNDIEGYEKFLRLSEKVYAIGFDRLLSASFDSLFKMIKVLPQLTMLQFYRSVYGLVARYIKHPQLRTVFSFHPLLVGGNPFDTTAIYTLIAHLERSHGVHYAVGGTGTLINGLVGLIKEQGGSLRYSSEAAEITVEHGRASGVRLTCGENLAADVVVSNADSAATYQNMIPPQYRRRWTNKKLRSAKYSMSLFVWYFGTDRTYDEVPHHMILMGPRYRGLLKDIFKHRRLSKDFSLYLHRPSASDPSLAPDGCDAFYVLSPVPDLRADVDWRQHAEPYRQAIEQKLATTVLPDLGKHIVTSRLMTPLDFEQRLNSVNGAAFSLQPTLFQTGWFRPHNRSEDIENLFIVGAGTHPGAGVPGVISSAKVLDEVVPDAR